MSGSVLVCRMISSSCHFRVRSRGTIDSNVCDGRRHTAPQALELQCMTSPVVRGENQTADEEDKNEGKEDEWDGDVHSWFEDPRSSRSFVPHFFKEFNLYGCFRPGIPRAVLCCTHETRRRRRGRLGVGRPQSLKRTSGRSV